MGRKIVWQVFLLVAVLAALYGQQEIFAQEDAQAICEEEEKVPAHGRVSPPQRRVETGRSRERSRKRSRLFPMRFLMRRRTGRSSTIR